MVGRQCYYCSAAAAEIEHIVPKCLGGVETVPSCVKCNRSKGGRSLEDWRVSLARNKARMPYFTPDQKEYLVSIGVDLDASLPTICFRFEGGDGAEIAILVSQGATRTSLKRQKWHAEKEAPETLSRMR